jgi:hypothetical protein
MSEFPVGIEFQLGSLVKTANKSQTLTSNAKCGL